MKRQTLLLVLVAVMSLAGATEAFCQRPERSKVRVKPKMDYRVKESAQANPIEEFLAEHGPHAGGNPGPFLPGTEVEELVRDIMIDILLEQKFGLDNYNRDVRHSHRRKPQNDLEYTAMLRDEIIGVLIGMLKDHPVIILDIDDLVENPAEYEGSDGDDIWDVLQGR